MKFRLFAAFAALAVLIGMFGCGGSGGAGGGTNNMSVFLTDDLNTGYSAVWVKIHEVELEYAGGSDKVFDSSAGVEFDLRSLNSAGANKFVFLNTAGLPARSYTGAKVTFAKDLTLFPTVGAPLAVQFDTAFDHGAGKSRVQFNFVAPVASSDRGSFVIDFDLANWTLAGGLVTPVIKLHSGAGLDDPANHHDEDWHGTVASLSNLGGGAYTFTLNVSASVVLKISVTSSTVVMNSNGGASPALSNGAFVEVRGKFNRTSGAIDASVVKLEDSSSSGEQKVEGAVSAINAGAGTFDAAATEVRGFIPSAAVVHVTTSATTHFFSDNGVSMTKEAFFAALSAGAKAEAEGTYTAGTNTLAAAKAKLEDHSGSDIWDEAKGAITAFSAAAGTCSINVTEWEGFAFSSGSSLSVVTTGSTTYRDGNGSSMTQAAFFAAMTTSSNVKVEGTFATGTMTAKRLEFRTSGGGGSGQHEAKGYASTILANPGSFGLDLYSWSGFNGSFGLDIVVLMSGTATYRDANGNSVTKEQFFSLLSNGKAIEVEGSIVGLQFTATKAKIED